MRRMKISSHYYCVVTSRCCCVAAPRSASLTHSLLLLLLRWLYSGETLHCSQLSTLHIDWETLNMATLTANNSPQNLTKYDAQADAWALLALKDATLGQPPRPVNNSQISKTPIAKISGKEFEYFVRQGKVVIGRNSSTGGEVDIHLGNSSFISRAHVEIHYEQSEFFLKCNGKNGVFMDGQFQRKTDPPLKLPKTWVNQFISKSCRDELCEQRWWL